MDKVMASELGFLGVNVDSNLDIPYVYLELVQKAEKGDKTAMFKLYNLSRHYEGENEEVIKTFINQAIERLEAEGLEAPEPQEGE